MSEFLIQLFTVEDSSVRGPEKCQSSCGISWFVRTSKEEVGDVSSPFDRGERIVEQCSLQSGSEGMLRGNGTIGINFLSTFIPRISTW